MWRGFVDKNCIYYTIFIANAKPWNSKSCLINYRTRPFSEVIVPSPVCKSWGTLESWCTYLTPFYSCFNSLSGPFWNYACRSCLLKLLLINCILWKVPSAHWKCIIRFLPFWLLWNPSNICSYAVKRALLFCKQTFVSLVQNVKSHEEMATVSVYQCNVLQYSIFLFSKERVLLFCLLCCAYFCLKGPAEQTKLLYFLHIHTLTCCSKTVSFI